MKRRIILVARLVAASAFVWLAAMPAPAALAAAASTMSATGGKPLRLKVAAPANKPDAPWNLVIINGLPDTFGLSKGTKLSNGSWALGPDDLSSVLVLSPRSYEGAVDLDIVFVAPDNTARERTQLRLLVWAAEGEPPASTAEQVPAPAPAPAPIEQTAAPTVAPGALPTTPTSNLAVMHKSALPDDVEDQIEFCRQLLTDKRVASARSMLEPLAVAGHAKAAHALAETFDPKVLRSLKITQVKPDIEKARAWYTKAKELGDPAAQASLDALPNPRRPQPRKRAAAPQPREQN